MLHPVISSNLVYKHDMIKQNKRMGHKMGCNHAIEKYIKIATKGVNLLENGGFGRIASSLRQSSLVMIKGLIYANVFVYN